MNKVNNSDSNILGNNLNGLKKTFFPSLRLTYLLFQFIFPVVNSNGVIVSV